MSKTILVLSSHTDDAEIAAGGTIAKWVEQGHRVIHRAFSPAIISLPSGTGSETTTKEFWAAQRILGTKGFVWDYPARTLPEHRQEILDLIVRDANKYDPDLVLGPSMFDCHQDHQIVAEEMIRAFRRRAEILSYEHPRNDRGFTPRAWCKLSEDHVEKKLEAIAAYKSQVQKRHSFLDRDSINAILRYRGMQINTEWAEAFEVIRHRF